MLSGLNYWIALSEDPKRSRVAGKTTTILVPRGPAGSFPNLPTNSLAISKHSKKKEIAYMYIMWMTQKRIMQFGQNAGVPLARRSVWTDPSYTPPTPAWGVSAKLAAEYGIAIAKPQAVSIGQMRDAGAAVALKAMRGGTRAEVQAEADKQAKVMTDLVKKTETGIPFLGATPSVYKKMPESEQMSPIIAESLENLGK